MQWSRALSLACEVAFRVIRKVPQRASKSPKEGQNPGFDLSLQNFSIKSSLAHRVLEPNLKVGCKFGHLLKL
jgi:hypothetical protein